MGSARNSDEGDIVVLEMDSGTVDVVCKAAGIAADGKNLGRWRSGATGGSGRSLWNREEIAEGVGLVRQALSTRNVGAYTLQAAIPAIHAEAPTSAAADWNEIVGLYDLLNKVDPRRWWN